MMNSPKTTTFAIALLCGVLSLPAVATMGSVADASGDIAVTVPAADLNLGDEQGVEKLYQRLKAAAREICGPQSHQTAGSLRLSKINKQCYHQALEGAVNRVKNDKLTELHTS